MAKPSLDDLSYGHFGQATYDLDSSSWTFARQPSQRGGLRQFTSWRSSIQPPRRFEEAPEAELHRSLYQSKYAATSLGRSDPALVPCLENVHELARVSAATTFALDTYDPAVGNLISFGTFTSEGYYRNPRNIVAVPSGECGNILQLTVLAREQYGWEVNKTPYLEGYGITGAESGYVIWGVLPIQQICFSQSEDRSMFLAVRTSTGISLFRPTHRGQAKLPQRSAHYRLPASRIDPGPVSSIPVHDTGGVPHADVAFNPDYQRQLGIVDQRGNWSVWDIDGGRKARGYRLSCTCRSSIDVGGGDLPSGPDIFQDDGWARIMWVGDVNTVLVCNRRNMEIFDTRGDLPTLLKCAELIPKRSADWILDVKRHPRDKHSFFVLTSTRLVLMAVLCQNDVLGNPHGEAGARVLLSWVHFRGTDDFTLQICVPAATEDESMVFVSSRLNHLISVYRFAESDTDSSLPLSNVDPVVLTIEGQIFRSQTGSRHIVSMHVQPLRFDEGESSHNYGPGQMYHSYGIKFFRLTVVTSDLGVHDTLVSSYDANIQSTRPFEVIVAPTDWHTVVRPRLGPKMGVLVGDMDDFVEIDGMDSAFDPHIKKPFHPPKFLRAANVARNETEDQNLMYSALLTTNTVEVGKMGEDQDFSALTEGIKDLLLGDAVSLEDLLLETLSEFGGMTIHVTDVDQASLTLEELRTCDSSPLELRHLVPESFHHWIHANDLEPTISQLYDSILQHWIAPLPTEVPNRLRQKKERFARHIATDVILAGLRIRLKEQAGLPETFPGSQSEVDPELRASQDSGVAVSMSSSSRIKESVESQDPPFSQHPIGWSQSSLPTPEPTPSIASGFTPSDHPSTYTALSRLSQHLQITKPLPIVPQNLNKVLLHWDLNSDPNTYDWDAATRAQDEIFGVAEDAEEDDDVHARELKQLKAKKKEERLAKRQKREQDLIKRQAESQPTVLRSSPGPMFGRGIGGSSQIPNQSQSQARGHGGGLGGIGLVQSQVEPGRHGGRPRKVKKKGRVSGF